MVHLVKPLPSPAVGSNTTPPQWTPPHMNKVCGKGQQTVGNNGAPMTVDEKANDTENPNTERTGPTRSADSSCEPPGEPLEK
jgi:hypothetical protein